MPRLARLLAAALLCASGLARAADIDALQLLTQQQFRLVSEDLGAALSYKPLTPAEPLGITGFDVGVSVTATRLKHSDLFDRITSSGNLPDYLPVPALRAYKGLPWGIDVGVMLSAIPGTNVKLYGGELRYAILSGNVALPAIAVRASYTKLNGVDQLDLNTKGVDLSISKGFLNFTPYAGVGQVWTVSTPNGVAGLAKESFSQTKFFAGLNVNVLLMNLALEADRTGEATTIGLKAGLRF